MSQEQAKIYVGNLPYGTDEGALESEFNQFGPILDVKLIRDRETGRSKGFAFITFEQPEHAQEALAKNGEMLEKRNIRVSIANDNRR